MGFWAWIYWENYWGFW